MTLSIILVSARVQQQFILVVNGLHGGREALKGNGYVFRAKKGHQRATERPLITTERCLTKSAFRAKKRRLRAMKRPSIASKRR